MRFLALYLLFYVRLAMGGCFDAFLRQGGLFGV